MRAWLVVFLLLPWIAHSRCAIEGLYQPKSDSEKVSYLNIRSDGNFEQRDTSGELLASGKVEEISPALWEVTSESALGPIKQNSKTLLWGSIEFAKVSKSNKKKVSALFSEAHSEQVTEGDPGASGSSSNTSGSKGTNWLWIAAGAAIALIALLVATQ